MQLSQDRKSTIDAVSVGPVIVTDRPEFLSGVGSLLAPGTSTERDKHRQYAAFLKSSQVDVGGIVKAAFDAQLRQHPTLGSKVKPGARYRFDIEVPYHALVQRNTFSDDYRPSVGLRVRLVGPGGEVISEGRASSCIAGDCTPYQKLDQIRANPDLLKSQYDAAARDAIRQVLEAL